MTKRWRAVTPKEDQLKVAYGRDPDSKDVELQYCWGPNEGGGKRAVNMMIHHWNHLKGHDGKSFIEELEARGYDITTLKFTIEKKK